MLNNQTRIVQNKISEFSLMWCMQLASHIKEPPYIPFFEVCTYGLVARYFGVAEKRIKNAYTGNRHLFKNNTAMLSGRDIAPVAIEKKNLGKSHGYLMKFPNGITTEIVFSANMVFNGRALLYMALILQNESKVAKDIADMLWKITFDWDEKHSFCRNVKPVNPWFLYFEEPQEVLPEPKKTEANIEAHSGDTVNVNITVQSV